MCRKVNLNKPKALLTVSNAETSWYVPFSVGVVRLYFYTVIALTSNYGQHRAGINAVFVCRGFDGLYDVAPIASIDFRFLF